MNEIKVAKASHTTTVSAKVASIREDANVLPDERVEASNSPARSDSTCNSTKAADKQAKLRAAWKESVKQKDEQLALMAQMNADMEEKMNKIFENMDIDD